MLPKTSGNILQKSNFRLFHFYSSRS